MLEFVKRLGGTVHLALEEGTQAQQRAVMGQVSPSQRRSKRSRFITLFQAAMKSLTNFC